LVEEGAFEFGERGEFPRVKRFEAAGLGLQGSASLGDPPLLLY
jgi:hypothetical protein